jgi:serine/threonine protein kinase
MKKVAHPNCVLLHEVYDESNKTYMVLDLITGGTVMVCMCPSSFSHLAFYRVCMSSWSHSY